MTIRQQKILAEAEFALERFELTGDRQGVRDWADKYGKEVEEMIEEANVAKEALS